MSDLLLYTRGTAVISGAECRISKPQKWCGCGRGTWENVMSDKERGRDKKRDKKKGERRESVWVHVCECVRGLLSQLSSRRILLDCFSAAAQRAMA